MRETHRSARLLALACTFVVAFAMVAGAATAAPTAGTGPADGLAGDTDGDLIAQSEVVGDDIVVEEGEVVTDDIEVAAGDVEVHGTVEGDVEAAAGSVTVTGEVTGDVHAAAGSVTVDGAVGGDVDAMAGSAEIREGAVVGGEVAAAAEEVVIEGRVDGDVTGAETVVLGSGADVGGDVEYGESLDRADGAAVAGTVSQVDAAGWSVGWAGPAVGPTLPDAPFGGAYALGAALLAGGLLVVVGSRFSADLVEQADADPLRTTVVGGAALVGVPMALVAVAITVVGIPVALAGGVAFAVAAVLAYAGGGFVLGSLALAEVGVESRGLALVAGVGGAWLAGRLPVVGGLLDLLVVAVGLGAGALVVSERLDDDEDGGSQPTPRADARQVAD